MRPALFALVPCLVLACAGPLAAQDAARPPCGTTGTVAATQQPATPAKEGEHSGTRPGDAGSTGWTGGTGGSYIGTTPSGPDPTSPQDHPAVARGLDPLKDTGPAPGAC